MTLRLASIAALCALVSGPALSLSCLPHSVTDTYAHIEQAEERYFVVHGTLTFDEALLPRVDMDHQASLPQSTDIPAILTGTSLSKQGFVSPFRAAVTLRLQCAGPWCARAQSGARFLAFVEDRDEALFLTLGPCGGDGFAEPDAAMLEQVKQCFRGGPCAPRFSY